MYPAVPLPKGFAGRSVDFKLKPGWRYDEAKNVFVSRGGEQFAPPSLPKQARILYKVPDLARSSPRGLSRAERDLQRYMQLVLAGEPPAEYVETVRAWPSVEEAHAAPEVSLPAAPPARPRSGRRKR